MTASQPVLGDAATANQTGAGDVHDDHTDSGYAIVESGWPAISKTGQEGHSTSRCSFSSTELKAGKGVHCC